MKPTYQDIKAAAQYRWPEIHAALGIDPRYLKNKHQPCPACGGKDRFRYDDKDGNGTFICSHYNNGAGDGFGLVMHFFGCDFQTALKQVSGVLGMDNAKPLADTANTPTSAATPRKRPNRGTGRIVEKHRTHPPRFPCYPVFEITRFGDGAFTRKRPFPT